MNFTLPSIPDPCKVVHAPLNLGPSQSRTRSPQSWILAKSYIMHLRTAAMLTLFGFFQLSFLLTEFGATVPANPHMLSLLPREHPCTAPDSPNPCESAYPCGVQPSDAEKGRLEQISAAQFVAYYRNQFLNHCGDCQSRNINRFVTDYLRLTFSPSLPEGDMICNAIKSCTVSFGIFVGLADLMANIILFLDLEMRKSLW